jgi:hypothetical protein
MVMGDAIRNCVLVVAGYVGAFTLAVTISQGILAGENPQPGAG